VWTPKRIVLLVLGFALFVTGYFSYAFALGGIDGLPPLPPEYLTPLDPAKPLPPGRTSLSEEQLREAFGLDCQELKRPIKLQLSRNNMVLAAEDSHFDDSGRLVLTPFSVAMFGKPKNDGRGVEINTIRCAVAILSFDAPVRDLNLNAINGRKIVGAELSGDIEVVNNRRTTRRDDDLELFIAAGPVYYLESTHLVWTHDEVHLTDRQNKPKPHEVWGKGMEMELLAEPAPAGPNHKQRQDTITGVKRITLQANVDMHLYVDGRSGFMGGHAGDKGSAKAKPGGKVEIEVPRDAAKDAVTKGEPAEKSHLNITTPGRFEYLFFKDHDTARFEVTPGGQPPSPGRTPRDVIVRRQLDSDKLGKVDQLICRQLDLRLVHNDTKSEATKDAKPPDKNVQPGDPDQSINIEWAHATGPEVTITSDAEKLDAHGVDLLYEAKASRTVLKGGPLMNALKEGNKIVAHELHIQEVKASGSAKTYQIATAIGPGQIDLLDKKTEAFLQHAYWNDRLVMTKDEQALTPKGDFQDLLILTGKARFEDEEKGQKLKGETLKVWLSQGAGDRKVEHATPAESSALSQQGIRPDHLEAIKDVSLLSSDLIVPYTARLVVWFKDEPPSVLPSQKEIDALVTRDRLPPPAAPPSLPDDGPRPLPKGPEQEKDHQSDKMNTPAPAVKPGAAPVTAPTKTEEPRPIVLTADTVEAYVLRGEAKNTLEKLWTEGHVFVRQAPAKPGDQGVEINGDHLNLIGHPDGNLLIVTGNDQALARIKMDKIIVVGPEVSIDQAKNEASVTGAGGMQIDSETTLSGKPLDHSEPLRIDWQKSMFLQGRSAEFTGGIHATQNQAKMACNVLQVAFDKPISLKEGNKSGESPKVKTLWCNENAHVEDVTYEGGKEDGKLMKYERLGPVPLIVFESLDPDEEDLKKPKPSDGGNQVRTPGPGTLRIVQRGGADPLAPSTLTPNTREAPKPSGPKPGAPKPGDKPADPDQLKLTVVNYQTSMYANSKTNFASFRGNVRVLNMPVTNPYMEVDIDVMLAKLPEGAMYLSCNKLQVWTREEQGKTYQEMHAAEQAAVQAREFWGRAASIHFDEAKDQVIFDGGPGGTASLYKMKQGEWDKITGEKIIYNRKTGECNVGKANSFQGGN
jgi:lipopolysaccharide export system protein LptA